MSQESKYLVVLLDEDGFALGERPAENLQEAKEQMSYLLSESYAGAAETTHEEMGTQKVEVRNAKGECVLDDFYGAKIARLTPR